ncbi:TIGR02678 family protein, partial [Geobacillus stearothermophilus]|uniref:TIGR02678 family protein n=1 Tax=Geobacillus stearothermophilus TaxID=1422 RepID=UPI002402CBBF
METAFDDKAKEALAALFEQFWIIRDQEPDLYQLVREREHVLKKYVEEKFGYRLIVHRYFAKLEKIPADPEPWMGIESFQEPLDYALFCCLMAYLEGKV